MAYDSLKPADTQFISAGPKDIRDNFEAVKTEQIVDAGKLKGLIPGNAAGQIPLNNGTVNVGLNAEKVGGNLPSAFAASTHTHPVATQSSAGLESAVDKTKLDGIAVGAQVNQNAFSNVLIGSTTIQADSPTDTIEVVAGANISITPDATNDRLTIGVTGKVASAISADTATTCTGNSATTTNADKVDGFHADTANVASTVAVRDGAGDVTCRLLRTEYTTLTGATGAYILTQNALGVGASGVDNYARPMTLAAFKTLLGSMPANGGNANTVSGLSVNTTGTNNIANQIVRTEANGYTQFAYINTNAPIEKMLASVNYFFDSGDGWIRKKSLADVKTELGVNPIADNIVNGMTLAPVTGLQASVDPGIASISGQGVNFDVFTNNITLSPRMISMLYATNNKTIGNIDGIYPPADAGHVVRYVVTGANPITNSAVGVGSLAVVNNLVKTGTVTQVAGLLDYAGRADGTSGYYTSSNSTNFPTGLSPVVELGIVITISPYVGQKHLLTFGVAGVYFGIAQYSATSLTVIVQNTALPNPIFPVIAGETYYMVYQSTGEGVNLFINGRLVYAWKGAFTVTAGSLNVFRYVGGGYYSNDTVHYVELKNTLRTPAQIAKDSNKMLLPCSYAYPQGEYPTIIASDLATSYHEYRFTETSGTTLTDSKGTLNGAIVGTTLVNSNIGLGKARRFATVNDYVTFGSLTVPTSSTIITVLKSRTNGRLFGSTDQTGVMWCTGADSSAFMGYWNGATWYNSTEKKVPLDVPSFIAFVNTPTTVSFYLNDEEPETINAVTNSKTFPAGLPKLWSGSGTIAYSDIDYFLYIPRDLSKWEIMQYYNSLMKTGKSDITEVLPTNAISLGLVNTDSTKVIEILQDYKQGRREGATGGNRRVFLGWKRFDGVDKEIYFLNKLGVENINAEIWYKKNLSDTNHTVLGSAMYSSSMFGTTIRGVSQRIISVYVGNPGVWNAHSYTKADESSGYIGLWIETK
jgi:hypothetical protein